MGFHWDPGFRLVTGGRATTHVFLPQKEMEVEWPGPESTNTNGEKCLEVQCFLAKTHIVDAKLAESA
jgi:hypothetical protein